MVLAPLWIHVVACGFCQVLCSDGCGRELSDGRRRCAVCNRRRVQACRARKEEGAFTPRQKRKSVEELKETEEADRALALALLQPQHSTRKRAKAQVEIVIEQKTVLLELKNIHCEKLDEKLEQKEIENEQKERKLHAL